MRCKQEYPEDAFPCLTIAVGGRNVYCKKCFDTLVAGDSRLAGVRLKPRSEIPVYRTPDTRVKRAAAQNHRAYKLRAEGRFSDADVVRLYHAQAGKCAYCNMELNGVFDVDHVHPLSRGGANSPDNLAIACPACNTSKSSKTLEEWKTRP